MRPLLALLALVPGVASAAGPVLTFAGDRPARLRLEVDAGPAWAAFLDKLFDHFDRDGNGSLSAAEAGWVFPLPLPDGRTAAMDFARLDTDRNGAGSRAEFHEFYRRAGFAPVGVVVRPTPPDAARLDTTLRWHLDRDRDGKLSAGELSQAAALVRRLDEDDDEAVSAAELLAGRPPETDAAPAAPTVTAGDGGPEPDGVLRLAADGSRFTLEAVRGGRFQTAPGGLAVPGGVCRVTAAAADAVAGFRAAKGFYLAQFGSAPGAGKAAFEDDPSLRVLAGLFDPADRDGDGQLSRAELDAFLTLVEAGIGCRVVVAVQDEGRSLFRLLDADGDGRLTQPELNAATRLRSADAVPHGYTLTAGRGTAGGSFGPVPLGTTRAKPAAARPPAAAAPGWFRAMDRNADGVLSPREFVGRPALFRQLDADGDGVVTTSEAAVADRSRPAP